jgi:hypothetical protein
MTSSCPPCPRCGEATSRIFHAPGVIWSKSLVEYNDPRKENAGRDQKNGGYWVNRTKSWGAEADGKPRQEFITTPAQQAAYCREEGLINPRDIPNNLSVTADGMGWETANKAEV